MRFQVRRKAALLLATSGLLTASALGASSAVAGPGATTSSTAVPAGWQRADSQTLARLVAESGVSARAYDASQVVPLLEIQSVRNGQYVAAERNYPAPYTGVLRARSTAVNLWELYDLYVLDETTGTVALNSHANGLYVAAELNYSGAANGLLRARSQSVATWEKFYLYYNDITDRYALQSVANGLFVSMENNYTGSLQYALRARSADIAGTWEEFSIIDSQSTSQPTPSPTSAS